MIRHDRYLMSQVFSPVHKEFSVKITKSIVGAEFGAVITGKCSDGLPISAEKPAGTAGCVAGYRDCAKRKVFAQLE